MQNVSLANTPTILPATFVGKSADILIVGRTGKVRDIMTNPHQMTALFQQLGLESDETAIRDFFERHYLPQDVMLADAPFWTPAQRAFLKESLACDDQWATIIDHMDASLRR
ncbi:DUF2789 domain-containing protein [Shewanella sp. YIC-542]|uniref:DUF2789 domain-containing protein n=1 Tax=Shewanella mytili TaxID=3377111 RepID=UPI00398E633A